MGLADRVAVMYGGGIDQIGPPLSVYATPATRFVGGFIGNPPMNFVKMTAERGVVRIGGMTLACPVAAGPVELGLRGEDAVLATSLDGAIPFHVRVVEPMGAHILLTGTILDQPTRIVVPPTATVEAGAQIGLSVDPRRLTWIDPETGKAIRA
jgi:multiple sugar transport system ATP-binding protein